MIMAYHQQNQEIPVGGALLEQMPVEDRKCQSDGVISSNILRKTGFIYCVKVDDILSTPMTIGQYRSKGIVPLIE